MDFVAALIEGRAGGCGKAAVDHPGIVASRRAFSQGRMRSLAVLAPSAPAEIGAADRRIHPVRGSPINGSPRKAFSRAVAEIRNQESGLAPMVCGKSGVRQVDHRHGIEPKVAIFQVHRSCKSTLASGAWNFQVGLSGSHTVSHALCSDRCSRRCARLRPLRNRADSG